jgi:hypothetical protein
MQVRLGVSAVCQHVQVFILKQQKSDQRIQAVCQLMQVNQKPQPELEFCPKVSSEVLFESPHSESPNGFEFQQYLFLVSMGAASTTWFFEA